MERPKNVLICVDEDIMLTALKFRMEKQGYNVLHVRNMKEAKEQIENNDIHLIISDLQMKGHSAVDLAKWSKAKNGDRPVPFMVMATLDDDETTLQKALESGVSDFIMKPFKPVELYFRINRIVPDLEV